MSLLRSPVTWLRRRTDGWRRTCRPKVSKGFQALAHIGIAEDCHADPFSPRQVLLAATGAYESLHVAPMSLRENILVAADELRWLSGTELLIGSDVVLRVTYACEPCARLNRFRLGLMRKAKGVRGTLARVIRGGWIGLGDTVRAAPAVFRALSDDWRERVVAVVQAIPAGVELSYIDVARIAGVHKSYCRVFPRLLANRSDLSAIQPSRIAPRKDGLARTRTCRGGHSINNVATLALAIVAAKVFGPEGPLWLQALGLSPGTLLTVVIDELVQ